MLALVPGFFLQTGAGIIAHHFSSVLSDFMYHEKMFIKLSQT